MITNKQIWIFSLIEFFFVAQPGIFFPYGRLGRISFKEDEDGFSIILHKKIGDPITFKELDGYAKTEMSKKKSDDEYGRIFALMGKMSGLGEHAVKKLKGPELSLVEAIGTTLLMG